MIRVAWNEKYAHSLPEGHRFPMEKYDLLPRQLVHEGTLEWENFFSPGEISEEMILRVHDQEYWNRLKNLELTRREQRTSGFPHNEDLITRERSIAQGTIDCTHFAMDCGVALNIAGGTHHAFTNRAEGFCLLNDQALASRYLLDNKLAKQILIVDLDVHQGNGTAEIFENEPRVFTFSMHGEKNYPLKKMISDRDIELPDNTSDEHYLSLLRENLNELVEKVNPDFVFYQCGVDILEGDKLGRMQVSLDGCKKRDEMVLGKFADLGIPVVCSMGGGYSKEIRKIVEAHANTFRTARFLFD
ncbi:histone deacetylase family protein [Halocola ammonii]